MKFLLDTNIFIDREKNDEIPKKVQDLLRYCAESKIEIFIHPSSKEDLKRDKDKERLKISLSKLKIYQTIKSPPSFENDTHFKNTIGGGNSENEYVDNQILYAIYRNVADFLITEDRGILKKASRLNLKGVLSINSGIEFIRRFYPSTKIEMPPALSEKPIYSINIEDPFFESLKKDYGESAFANWWKKICKEHRTAYVYAYPDKTIGAILILKEENETIGDHPILKRKKRIKICTLKVSHEGNRIGELFLKIAFRTALSKNINEIYLTRFINKKESDPLSKLLYDAGFNKVSRKRNGEYLFLKKLKNFSKLDLSRESRLEINRIFYPSFYDGKLSKKFIIPIQPKWHERLFIEGSRQTTLNEHSGRFIVEGNTIEKAYLTNSQIKKLKPSDIILFYRSKDVKGITAIGVIKKVYFGIKDRMQIIKLVGNRTVYSEKEIAELCKKPTTVILFRWQFNFRKIPNLEELKKDKILKGTPQSILEIDDSNYKKIKQMTELNTSFTIN